MTASRLLLTYLLTVATGLSGVVLAGGAQAQVLATDTAPLQQASPVQVNPVQAAAGAQALVVTGVIIDKTAANAVVAREEAMADARRAAFRKLAEAHMDAQAAMDLPLPDDARLATLVQDIEIKRERLSATRYVGDFTVRFRDGVRRYIPVPAADGGSTGALATTVLLPAPAMAAPAGSLRLTAPVVILPYIRTIAGQMLLWGEPNAWRDVWQAAPPQARDVLPAAEAAQAEGKVIVPLGDISDISAGSDAALWSGNYAALDRLRQNYGVQTVVVAVANRSGAQVRVDLYDYAGGSLVRRGQVVPVIDAAQDDRSVFALAARDTLRAILTQPATQVSSLPAAGGLEAISRGLTGQQPAAAPVAGYGAGYGAGYAAGYAGEQAAPAPVPSPLIVSGKGTQIQAGMRFDDFMTWMDTQKRLADIVPPVRVNIQAISRDQARFTLAFEGDMQVLGALLSEQGLRLTQTGAADYALSLVP